jgi:glycosyltransferase involved in cell wall biosynthesis
VKPKLAIVSNTSWSIYNFRRNLIRTLLAAKFDVVAIAPPDSHSSDVASLGCRYVPLKMNGKGRNPIEDLSLFLRLTKLFRREAPNCVLTFTPKPNIYGCWAARTLGIPAVANVAGLGSVFVSRSITRKLVQQMYRVALKWPEKVFFQNCDDLSLFTSLNIVDSQRSELLPGSGVDLHHYSPQPRADGTITFLFSARLLGEKGINEYVAAAKRLKQHWPDVQFRVLGFTDAKNPSAVSAATLEHWNREGTVSYLGDASDVRPFIADSDCVVLPSYYREGVPRTLLEAASMGKPVITTDMPGCRSVVEDTVTGLLVRPRDVDDLTSKMGAMIAMTGDDRQRMGKKAREKMIQEFDERIVLRRYLDELHAILARSPASATSGSVEQQLPL